MAGPATRAFDRAQREYWASHTNVRAHDHPVVQAFAAQRVRFIRRLLGPRRPGSALEVGCGDGFGMQAMSPLVGPVHGCDLSAAMLAANPARQARLVQASAYALPFASASFDLVYCWELLHHLGDPSAAVAEMRRVARRWILVCEPNALNPLMAAFGLLVRHERGTLRFTPGSSRRLLTEAGIRRVRTCSVGTFTPNRTPRCLVRFLARLPYRWPLVGLYTITLGEVAETDPTAGWPGDPTRQNPRRASGRAAG